MAATRFTAPSARRGGRDGSRLAPVAGLVALLSSVAVLIVGAILPASRPLLTEVSAERTTSEAANQIAPSQDNKDPHAPIALVAPVFGDHLAAERAVGMRAALTHQVTCRAQPLGEKGVQAKVEMATGEPSPARWDLREDLARMAAAQHRGRWAESAPFLTSWHAAHGAAGSNSDDRIANALFGPSSPGQSSPEVIPVAVRCVSSRAGSMPSLD